MVLDLEVVHSKVEERIGHPVRWDLSEKERERGVA
jgi:hypothetical protein